MNPSRETIEHVFACLNTMYRVLGESAPNLGNDAYVVRTYEMARSLGEVTLVCRAYLGQFPYDTFAPLEETLHHALDTDESGAMLVFALVAVVGPRVLVSLRDARELVALDDAALEIVNLCSQTLVRELLVTGDVAKDHAPIEDPGWQERARSLERRLEEAGYAESFGISR